MKGASRQATSHRDKIETTAEEVCGLIDPLTAQINRSLVPYRMKTLITGGLYAGTACAAG
jgi:hypothetical protein